MTKREELINLLSEDAGAHVPESVCNIIHQLLTKEGTKSTLMEIAYPIREDRNRVDSAYPQPLADSIRQIDVKFRGHFRVYDYNEQRFGVLENVAELTIEKIFSEMSKHRRG